MPQQPILHKSILASLDSLIDRLNSTRPPSQPSVVAILVGTTDGIGLARCYGTATDSSSKLSEEILSSVETVWSTLPSNASQGAGNLLRPLQMGSIQSSVAFYDDDTVNITMVHLHLFPLMVTILANGAGGGGSPANIGAIRSNFEGIRSVLEPLRRELENSVHQQQQQQQAAYGGATATMKI
jgi:hypothetical protein